MTGPTRSTPLRFVSGALLRIALFMGISTVLVACQTVQTTRPGVVGVDRPQSMAVSSARMNQAAEEAYARELAKARQAGALNTDISQVNRVRAIANRLIAQTGAFRPDALQWRWDVNVIASDQVNAFCMAGGKIAVYTGLINRLQASDAELAAVMGHEIAHALREHSREQVSRQMAIGALGTVAGAATGSAAVGDLAGMVSQVTFGLPNSREAETESDRIGVELAARAGYDPHAAVTLWQKMANVGGSRAPQFLSTHPSPANRIADLRQYSERVMPLYLQSRR
jgi:predicted Zn-dependent protease